MADIMGVMASEMMPDADRALSRYVRAQENRWSGYTVALREIRNGRKVSHWIWYIFPQLRGLGSSHYSNYYGIEGREEAEAYLAHPVLGQRLREITSALLSHADKSANAVFGGIDAMKVRSCMTLFDCVSPDDLFSDVLARFYNGERDPRSVV